MLFMAFYIKMPKYLFGVFFVSRGKKATQQRSLFNTVMHSFFFPARIWLQLILAGSDTQGKLKIFTGNS